jgi:hypothetical protein
VLDTVLQGHEPYRAWVVRQPFTFVRANAATEAPFPGLTRLSPAADRLLVRAGPFRECVLNWPDVIQAGLAALRHAAADVGDAQAAGLLRRAEAHAPALAGSPEVPGG